MSDAHKPAWHEEDHPSHSMELRGVSSPMHFAEDAKRVAKKIDVGALKKGVLSGDRVALAQAITLIESSRDDHRAMAEELLAGLYPHSGKALRVGVTGVPGVGKSTLLEAFGMQLVTQQKRKLAVLTIDPSSELTGGSILGDKTRMEQLCREENAFIRPSPSRGVLGGVSRWTREAMILCEAAGYDTIFVETVGVGQSETLIRGMVDCFLLLTLAGAGDELQGIKKGIMELADVIAVTKADGDNKPKAEAARAQLAQVTTYLQTATPDWEIPVLAISAFDKTGLDQLWEAIVSFEKATQKSGIFAARRLDQKSIWLKTLLRDKLTTALDQHHSWQAWLKASEKELPTSVATRVMKELWKW